MSDVRVVSQPSKVVKVIASGAPGLSAYEVALEEGFTGTQSEWLTSLANGGLSVSQVSGNILTLETDGLYATPTWATQDW